MENRQEKGGSRRVEEGKGEGQKGERDGTWADVGRFEIGGEATCETRKSGISFGNFVFLGLRADSGIVEHLSSTAAAGWKQPGA
ncbi:MAG: hypothetical protein AAB092_01440 [Chloroflexota bacterium]